MWSAPLVPALVAVISRVWVVWSGGPGRFLVVRNGGPGDTTGECCTQPPRSCNTQTLPARSLAYVGWCTERYPPAPPHRQINPHGRWIGPVQLGCRMHWAAVPSPILGQTTYTNGCWCTGVVGLGVTPGPIVREAYPDVSRTCHGYFGVRVHWCLGIGLCRVVYPPSAAYNKTHEYGKRFACWATRVSPVSRCCGEHQAPGRGFYRQRRSEVGCWDRGICTFLGG